MKKDVNARRPDIAPAGMPVAVAISLGFATLLRRCAA